MPQAKRPPVSKWRNRIVGLEYHRPSELADHPHQWRIHGELQRRAMEAILREIGIAGAGLAYVSPSTGQLTSIDGHLRKALDDGPFPHLILDLNDAEAELLLASYDPLAALAEANRPALGVLLEGVQSEEAALQQMLSELAENHGLYVSPPRSLDELAQDYGDEDPQAFWKTIRVQVPPEVYARYHEILGVLPGEDEATKFAALLDACDA